MISFQYIFIQLHHKAAVTDLSYFTRSTFSFTRKILGRYDKYQNDKYFAKGGRVPLVSLNEIAEKLRPALVNFINNPQLSSYWPIVFGKYLSLVKSQSTFT